MTELLRRFQHEKLIYNIYRKFNTRKNDYDYECGRDGVYFQGNSFYDCIWQCFKDHKVAGKIFRRLNK